MTARTAVLKHPSEHGETQIWAYTVLPGTHKSISDSSSVLSLPCGSQSQKEMGRSGGAMRTTEKLLCFGYILAYPQALCKLSLPLLEI